MQDWPKMLFQALDDMSEAAEDVLLDITQEFHTVANQFASDLETFSQDISEELETIADEITRQVEVVVSTEFEELGEFLELLRVEFEDSFTDFAHSDGGFSDPLQEQHEACRGCRHYHGQVYGGNLLVCGMYPYGPDPSCSTCPDWAAE